MKKTLLALTVLLSSLVGVAQSELLVKHDEKGLYLSHTVSAKENFYSLGRLYNISPKDIAAFNSLDMKLGLGIGQAVMIPLNASNFSQITPKGKPVYYVVGEKEGLYRVSANNNKVQLENLRKWNNLNGDEISTGQKLIIGYLNATGAPANTAMAAATTAKKEAAPSAAKETPKPEAKETVKVEVKETVVQKDPPAAVQKKEEPVVQTKAPEVKPVAKPASALGSVSGSGYFKNQFDAQSRKFPVSKEQTVTASIFKTASGWQDGKYYALLDGVEPGTIIRVINPTNNKAVYAKVLGEMSGIRQNQGLEVRISNAAASALDADDTEKFIVKLNY